MSEVFQTYSVPCRNSCWLLFTQINMGTDIAEMSACILHVETELPCKFQHKYKSQANTHPEHAQSALQKNRWPAQIHAQNAPTIRGDES